MDWWIILIAIIVTLLIILLSGIPVAFAFLLFNFIGVLYFMGPEGFRLLILGLFSALTQFTIAPVPLFILMGSVIFHSGIAVRVIDIVDKWMGHLPGRLSLLTVASGTIFANLTGSTIANTAMLGTLLLPEMERRGYKKSMTLGPIMGVGGLAMIIPPSALAVILGSLGKISIGKLLIAGILPGLLIAVLYATYIIVRCRLQPSLAPSYDVVPTPWSEKFVLLAKHVFPLVFIVLAVLGSMFAGIATPTEAAALGALAAFVLAAVYGKLNLKMVRDSTMTGVEITVMAFMIIAGSITFSKILAFTGVSRELVEMVTSLDVAPILILIAMQVVLLFLGTFMEQVSMMMITLPIYMPVVHALGFNDLWFGIMMLINLEIGLITPPFGMLLFVMKGVSTKGTTMGDIYRAALPFVAANIIALAIILAFPIIVTFLPDIMLR